LLEEPITIKGLDEEKISEMSELLNNNRDEYEKI
jgi:hypothetical protein